MKKCLRLLRLSGRLRRATPADLPFGSEEGADLRPSFGHYRTQALGVEGVGHRRFGADRLQSRNFYFLAGQGDDLVTPLDQER